MVEYVYRGNEEEAFVEELESGAVHGSLHDIYRGELNRAPSGDPKGQDINDLDWDHLVVGEEYVTGGVSDSLAQTNRFSGASNYAMVLSARDVAFEPIEYNYDWFNDHPGVYDHVLSASRGEIRLEGSGRRQGGDLYGTVNTKPMVSGPDKTEIRHWGGRGDLPGMGGSRFEDESEWVALQQDVTISNAIEGVVSVIEPISARVSYTRDKDMVPGDAPHFSEILPEVYEKYRDPLPEWTSFYLLIVDDIKHYKRTSYEGWRTEDILAAYRDDGEVKPEHVPARFRGENTGGGV